MTPLRRTLFFQLSLIFLGLVILTVVGSCYALWVKWEFAQDTTLQRVNWNLAASIAKELQPVLQQPVEREAVGRAFLRMSEINPRIDLYIVGSKGEILFTRYPFAIPPSPTLPSTIQAFLQFNAELKQPIYGVVPGRGTDRRTVFSAAEIEFDGQPAWLYVVLNGTTFRAAKAMYGTNEMTISGAALLSFGLLLALLLGLLVLFAITRRFSQMTRVLNEFREGNYSQRIASGRNDEIGTHAEAFNSMADTIEAHIASLKNVDSRRRQLFANISHELRRPLTLMHSVLETLIVREERLTAEQRLEFLEQSLNRCRGLDKLVGQLFELSKLSSDDKKPIIESFSITDMIDESYNAFLPLAKQKQIKMDYTAPEELKYVSADPQMIETVILNLIENAIRYTNEAGEIQITVTQQENSIITSISDTGVGIPEEDLEYIFDRFYRSSTAKAQSSAGTGLGLAIVKKMLELHNSELQVQSEVGRGSVFSFSLPVA